MSELDINSDSDWLDISSGRDSDDNVSLSDQDSDRDEISSVPRSRRSSFSTESSMGGDVEAWEGFVSDSGDEIAHALNGMYPVTIPSATRAEPLAVRPVPGATETAIADEDKRVKDALDQSFVGTLSASRSSSAGMHNSSTHTSLRDLRLSFPDPLTSSRNELNRSYEDVPSPTGSDLNSSAEFEADSIIELPAPASSLPHCDPGSLFITPGVQRNEDKEANYKGGTELDIILYGTSSAIKWSFVQELIQKAIYATGHDVLNTLQDDKSIQSLHLSRNTSSDLRFFETINVIDRTGESGEKMEHDYDTSGRTSLAIVYLPTAQLPLITWHDIFLPVLIPSAPEVESQNTVMLQAAEDDWDLLAVPMGQTLRLVAGDSLVFDSEKVSDLKPSKVYELLYNIGQQSKPVNHTRPLTEKIKMNPMTIVGLMSVVMGLAVNTMLHSPAPPPTPTVNSPSSSSQLWQVLAPQPNRSVVAHSTSYNQAKGCGISSTFEQLALSVYDTPGALISAVASSSQDREAASTSKCKQCSKTSTDLQRASTDVAIRLPSSSLSQDIKAKSSLATVSSSKAVATKSSVVPSSIPKTVTTAASTSSAGLNNNYRTISEAFDATTKVFTEAFNSDFKDLAVVADDLLSSFREQTDNVIRQSKGKARALSDQIRNLNDEVASRNERAKKRAKQLRKKGGDIVRVARDELKERTDKARRRARHLGQTVIENGCEAWTAYGAQLQEGGKESINSKLAKKRRERYEKWREICEQQKHARLERDKRLARDEKENSGGSRGTHWKSFGARHQ